jgi:tRNA(fMet)-specific endonuclease VapC
VKYFLDTDTCIYALNNRRPNVGKRLVSKDPSEIGIPSIVKAELYYGANKSNRAGEVFTALENFLLPFQIVPFCEKSAVFYGELRSKLEAKGEPVGPNDLILASTAKANGAVLVTNNQKEFSKIEGLLLENWI